MDWETGIFVSKVQYSLYKPVISPCLEENILINKSKIVMDFCNSASEDPLFGWRGGGCRRDWRHSSNCSSRLESCWVQCPWCWVAHCSHLWKHLQTNCNTYTCKRNKWQCCPCTYQTSCESFVSLMLGGRLQQLWFLVHPSPSYSSCITSHTLHKNLFLAQTCGVTHSRLLLARWCNMLHLMGIHGDDPEFLQRSSDFKGWEVTTIAWLNPFLLVSVGYLKEGGRGVAQLDDALCCKSAGCRFNSQWQHWNSLT